MENNKIDNLSEVMDFIKSKNIELGVMYNFTIYVQNKSGAEVFEGNVPVSFGFDSNYRTIDIFWEDVGFADYKSLGLFGRHNTLYDSSKMIIDKGRLKIIDSNGNELYISQ